VGLPAESFIEYVDRLGYDQDYFGWWEDVDLYRAIAFRFGAMIFSGKDKTP